MAAAAAAAAVDRAEKRSQNPPGDEKWMAGLLFSIRRVRITYIYTQSGFFLERSSVFFYYCSWSK